MTHTLSQKFEIVRKTLGFPVYYNSLEEIIVVKDLNARKINEIYEKLNACGNCNVLSACIPGPIREYDTYSFKTGNSQLLLDERFWDPMSKLVPLIQDISNFSKQPVTNGLTFEVDHVMHLKLALYLGKMNIRTIILEEKEYVFLRIYIPGRDEIITVKCKR